SGVAWGDHDSRLQCGVAAFYRNGYRNSLVPEWIPALDGVIDKLGAGINVADVGCGFGHSTVLMAQAFPQSHFYGFDPHEPSVVAANHNATLAGMSKRAKFEVAKAVDYPDRQYGLICFFDCLHDMGDPVAAVQYAAQ